ELSNNQVGVEGAKAISNLKNLTHLNLNVNNIGDDGAKAIAQLQNLTALDLMYNEIGDEGANAIIENLHALEWLNFLLNKVTLAYPFSKLSKLTGLMLNGDLIRDVPENITGIFKNCFEDISAWWAATANTNETAPNRWAGMQLTGNGTVGKSTLVKALQNGYWDKAPGSTDGVQFEQLTVKDEDGHDIQLAVWDF